MNYTVNVINGKEIKSMQVDASNQKEAKIKIKKQIGKERIIGIKVSE